MLLYELVSGVNPFEGSTYGVTVDRILRIDPPPLVTPAHQPSTLAPVVARCLAKDPKDRYASTSALVTDLEQVHAASGGHATPGSGSKRVSTEREDSAAAAHALVVGRSTRWPSRSSTCC